MNYSNRPDQQPPASEAAQAAVRGQVRGARVAADAAGLPRPARARAPRGRALPHAPQRRRATRRRRAAGAAVTVSVRLLDTYASLVPHALHAAPANPAPH